MSYQVVINPDAQYSVWPASDPVPAGWIAEGTTGTRDECLDHIERIWTDMRPARPRIRAWLADAVSAASDGTVTATDVLAAECSFAALGVSSLAIVRLVDAIEMEFDVAVDFGGGNALADLDSLTEFVAAGWVRSLVT